MWRDTDLAMEDTSWMKKKFIRWMEDNRGLILTVFGLPLSFIFDLVMQVYKVAITIATKLGSSKYAGSNSEA